MKLQDCPHYKPDEAAPRARACEECGATFSLRTCTTCGHVGCCESQQGHNTKHARSAAHPVIRALTASPREGFLWCYQCNAYLEK
jgi:CPA1 family monovalent cation:H+ antiporter